jgi:enoyl-CoA hydratase/carnithine racemase
MLMGLNRARYLMLTGQVLNAKEAKDIGLVAELMPRDKLLPRAWELAEQLATKSDMLLRYTRAVLTHPLRKQLDEGLQYFLGMEALSTLDKAQRS